uniref:Reverse transcriptase domain-containing protein n=1 Tax=Angiostrongylus cantonensis TaxID=6313 RepID=A0A0K0DJY0_ANGCA
MDGRQIHHLHFADDIVLITPDISQAERMLADFDKACGKIGLRLNLKKTMFMKNGLVSFAPFTLNGTTSTTFQKKNDVYEERIGFVCPIHAQRNEYLGMLQLCLSRSGNQYDERLSSRAEQKETSGLGSFQERRGCSEEDKNTRLRALLFDSKPLRALTYASETCSLLKQDERSLSVMERAVEETMLGVSSFAQRLGSEAPTCVSDQ